MKAPPAVCAKAQRLEQFLLRVEAGEPRDQVGKALGVELSEAELAGLQARYEAGGRNWEALVDGRYGHPQKMHSGVREWLYARKREEPDLTAQELAQKVAEQFQIRVSGGHINYLLRKVGLTGPRGRRFQKPPEAVAEEGEEGAEEGEEPGVEAHAGLFFLEGAKQVLAVGETVEQTVEEARVDYRKEHPDVFLRVLGNEPETTWHKLDHLLYLPVLGLTRPRDLYYYQGEG